MDEDLAVILWDFKRPEVVLPDGTVKFMPKNQRTFDTAAQDLARSNNHHGHKNQPRQPGGVFVRGARLTRGFAAGVTGGDLRLPAVRGRVGANARQRDSWALQPPVIPVTAVWV